MGEDGRGPVVGNGSFFARARLSDDTGRAGKKVEAAQGALHGPACTHVEWRPGSPRLCTARARAGGARRRKLNPGCMEINTTLPRSTYIDHFKHDTSQQVRGSCIGPVGSLQPGVAGCWLTCACAFVTFAPVWTPRRGARSPATERIRCLAAAQRRASQDGCACRAPALFFNAAPGGQDAAPAKVGLHGLLRRGHQARVRRQGRSVTVCESWCGLCVGGLPCFALLCSFHSWFSPHRQARQAEMPHHLLLRRNSSCRAAAQRCLNCRAQRATGRSLLGHLLLPAAQQPQQLAAGGAMYQEGRILPEPRSVKRGGRNTSARVADSSKEPQAPESTG